MDTTAGKDFKTNGGNKEAADDPRSIWKKFFCSAFNFCIACSTLVGQCSMKSLDSVRLPIHH